MTEVKDLRLMNCRVTGQEFDPERPAITIFGPKMPSEYGRYMARAMVQDILKRKPEMQFITGMSLGIDRIVIQTVQKEVGTVLAVMPTGLDALYPPEMNDVYGELYDGRGGGLISPFENHFGITDQNSEMNYQKANDLRILLSDKVLFIEGRLSESFKKKAMAVVNSDKYIYAIPGRVTDRLSDGTNYLLKNGAALVTEARDLFDAEGRW